MSAPEPQLTEFQRIRAAESRIEFALAGMLTFLVAGTLVYVYTLFAPIAPRLNVLVWSGCMGAVTLVMFLVPAVMLIRRPDDREIAFFWSRLGKFLTAAFDLAVASSVWLLLPYASEPLQLLMVIFYSAAISGQVISTAESIDNISFGVVVIFGSAALFFLQSESNYAVSLAFFLMAFGVLMIGVALVLKYAIRSAIVSRMRAEEASAKLAAALAEAQKARDDRTTFIAAASHDLRQPVQAALLFFEQLLMNPAAAQRQRAQHGVRQALMETNVLLDRMLEHLRLESGTMPIALAPVELAPLIRAMAQEHELIARNAGMRLIAFGSPYWIMADPHLLSRILRNLLHNGFAHAQGERIAVVARRVGQVVRLYVIDDGIGLAQAGPDNCFKPYSQGKRARGRAQGMGLGLAVSQEMARLMHGELAVDPRWQNGAAFYVSLPLLDAAALPDPALRRPSAGRETLRGLRIVVIDDEPQALQALAELLALIGAHVFAVGHLAALEQLDCAGVPDLFISDWHLGESVLGADALAVARHRWPGVAAVFITGDGAPETLQAISRSGIPVLWKPTDIDALGAIVAQIRPSSP